MFYGLTPLGVAHTVVSLIAVTAGLIALIRDREISPRNVVGKFYVTQTKHASGKFGRLHHREKVPLHHRGVRRESIGRSGRFGFHRRYCSSWAAVPRWATSRPAGPAQTGSPVRLRTLMAKQTRACD